MSVVGRKYDVILEKAEVSNSVGGKVQTCARHRVSSELYLYVNVKYFVAMTQAAFGIGDLASEFAVTTRTIRFYEDRGMIAPRREGRRRVYGPRDRTRLKLILRGRRLGFSLSEIAEIVDLYDAPRGEARQLTLLIDKVATRRVELESKRQDIEASLQDLDGVIKSCRKRLRELKKRDGK